MKTIPTIILLIILCYGNSSTQRYIEVDSSNKEKATGHSQSLYNPMPQWEKNWSKESVIAINEIIGELGYPDEYSPTRMYWFIPGEINRTITYTENFLFEINFETNSFNKDSDY